MGLFSDLPNDEGPPGAQRRIGLIAMMTGTAMTVLDGTIVNIALPQIATALAVRPGAAIWVANGYLLAVAMTLDTFAALAARVGYRNQYAAGLAVFTLASFGCALAPSLDVLIAMRLLQGLGSAAILSIGPALLRTIFRTGCSAACSVSTRCWWPLARPSVRRWAACCWRSRAGNGCSR